MIDCPICGKPGRVDKTETPALTRKPLIVRVTRRYVCRGGHGFTTTEVLADQFSSMVKAQEFVEQVKEMARA